MSHYQAVIEWARETGAGFTDHKYSRGHTWTFDGGAVVPASSSPHVVPLPGSVEANVDPEEAFIASLSSCHMLFYLSRCAGRGFVVDRYRDEADGEMGKRADGRVAMLRVVLRPRVTYSGRAPDRATEAAMHHESHERCFIANSVTTEVQTDLGPAA